MKYEYKVIEFSQYTLGIGGEEGLNKLGQEGWELVSFTLEPYYKYIFKRPTQVKE